MPIRRKKHDLRPVVVAVLPVPVWNANVSPVNREPANVPPVAAMLPQWAAIAHGTAALTELAVLMVFVKVNQEHCLCVLAETGGP